MLDAVGIETPSVRADGEALDASSEWSSLALLGLALADCPG